MSVTRRSILGWLSALPVVGIRRPSANPPSEVLPDQATPPGIPVVEFDIHGNIANANEIFGDMPFAPLAGMASGLGRDRPWLTRTAGVYLTAPVRSDDGYWQGLGRLIHSRGHRYGTDPGSAIFESLVLVPTEHSTWHPAHRSCYYWDPALGDDYFAAAVTPPKKPA